MRTIEVEGLFNARTNSEGAAWIVRSGTTAGLTAQGRAELDRLGVGAVIDLREPSEVGPRTHELPIHAVPLYGQPAPGIGRLEDIYDSLLNTRGEAFAAAVALIAEADSAVLVHCTAGKDRTGLLMALVLAASGSSTEEIVDDYVRSADEVRQVRAHYAARLAEEAAPGARSEILRLHLESPREAIEHALSTLASHGGAASYLSRHGLTRTHLTRLRNKADHPRVTGLPESRSDGASGDLSILHLSDIHAISEGLLYDRVDGIARLAAVADYVRDAGITPAVVVVTGDLIERGNADAYPRLNAALSRLEEIVGAPVITVLGNHDDRERSRILPGHEHTHHGVIEVERLRIVRLDSSAGRLGTRQIAWLREVLAEPFGIGTVLALHHPPLGSPLPALVKAGLSDSAEFLSAIAGTDVRAVLAGHLHHPLTAALSGVCVAVGPSLAYHQVMNAGPNLVSGHDSAMFSLVHLTPTGTAVTNFNLHAPPPLFSTPVPAGSLTSPITSR